MLRQNLIGVSFVSTRPPGAVGVSAESWHLSASKRLPEDSGNLEGVGGQLVACGFTPSELRAGRSAASTFVGYAARRSYR